VSIYKKGDKFKNRGTIVKSRQNSTTSTNTKTTFQM